MANIPPLERQQLAKEWSISIQLQLWRAKLSFEDLAEFHSRQIVMGDDSRIEEQFKKVARIRESHCDIKWAQLMYQVNQNFDSRGQIKNTIHLVL